MDDSTRPEATQNLCRHVACHRICCPPGPLAICTPSQESAALTESEVPDMSFAILPAQLPTFTHGHTHMQMYVHPCRPTCMCVQLKQCIHSCICRLA